WCTKVMGYRVAETFKFAVDFLKLGLAFLQLCRLLRQLIFRGFALGYVACHMHGANKLSLRIVKRCCAHKKITTENRFVYFGHMLPAIPASMDMWTELRRAREAMNNFVTSGTNALVRRKSQTFSHRLIHPDNPMLFVEDSDQVRNRIEGSLPFFLCPDDRFLDPFMLGDIAAISDEAFGLPCRTTFRNISSLEKLKLTT